MDKKMCLFHIKGFIYKELSVVHENTQIYPYRFFTNKHPRKANQRCIKLWGPELKHLIKLNCTLL